MKVRPMARAALFAALMAVSAWISIPLPPVRFTLQTLAMLLALGLLGGKWGSVSIFLYLLLGIVGLPVFSGFRSGVGAMLDATGGFLWGFFLGGLGYWLAERFGKIPGMVTFLLISYSCGVLWFLFYAPGSGLWGAATVTVLPYLLPEAVKLWLANVLVKRIQRNI